MRQSVFAMCGLAFSGKSSAARRIVDELGIDLISLDAINHERGLRGGEGIAVEEWERTSLIAMARLDRLLGQGASAVVDDTFSHRFLRNRCRDVAQARGARFLVLYMATDLAVIERRRSENLRYPTRHHVRDDVFAAHLAEFQHPAHDEPVVSIASDACLLNWLAIERDGKIGAPA